MDVDRSRDHFSTKTEAQTSQNILLLRVLLPFEISRLFFHCQLRILTHASQESRQLGPFFDSVMFKSLKKKIESDPHQEIHLASNKKPGGPIRLSAATSDDESNETKRCEPNQSLNADEEELARTKDDEEIPEVFVEPKLSDSKNALAIKTKVF